MTAAFWSMPIFFLSIFFASCLKLKVAEIYTGNLTWENERDAYLDAIRSRYRRAKAGKTINVNL